MMTVVKSTLSLSPAISGWKALTLCHCQPMGDPSKPSAHTVTVYCVCSCLGVVSLGQVPLLQNEGTRQHPPTGRAWDISLVLKRLCSCAVLGAPTSDPFTTKQRLSNVATDWVGRMGSWWSIGRTTVLMNNFAQLYHSFQKSVIDDAAIPL